MNCRESSKLLSEALDRELTPGELSEVEEHLAICPACTRCRKQFEALRRGVRRVLVGEA